MNGDMARDAYEPEQPPEEHEQLQRDNTAVVDIIRNHIPSLSDADDLELDKRRYNSDVDRHGQPAVDNADLALRTCHCGRKIDGFYDYVDHLIEVVQ